MRPVYFPFTTIAEPALNAVTACFGPPVVYQPWGRVPEFLGKWAKDGRIEICIPVSGDEDKLDRVLNEFHQWSDVHRGADMRFFKTQRKAVPFFNESSRTQILKEIKTQIDEKPAAPPKDPLFDSRLFLQIAQQWDLQNMEIDQGLKKLESFEMTLQRHLKGSESSELSEGRTSKRVPHDPGSHMTLERLRAWARIMASSDELPGLLVTTSRAAFDAVMEKIPQTQLLLKQEGIASNSGLQDPREAFMKNLEKLTSEKDFAVNELSGPETDPASSFSLELYLAPECSAMDVLAQLFNNPNEFKQICKAPLRRPHTLLALAQEG